MRACQCVGRRVSMSVTPVIPTLCGVCVCVCDLPCHFSDNCKVYYVSRDSAESLVSLTTDTSRSLSQ